MLINRHLTSSISLNPNPTFLLRFPRGLSSCMPCSSSSALSSSSGSLPPMICADASVVSVSRNGAASVSSNGAFSISSNGALLDLIDIDQQQQESGMRTKNTVVSSTPRLGRLDDGMQFYTEKFVIRCYEVGMNRTASIETIANLLQEVACNHAQSVGFSTDGFATTPAMRKKRLIWVTTRMHIEIECYPEWGDIVEVETWCQGEGKAGIRRDWLVRDVATNKQIGRATSTWVMMNQDTRRLSRMTDDIREEYSQYCPVIARYAFPEENSCSLKKIPNLQDPAHYVRRGLTPRRGDLDMNQHVNNVTYIGWILESMPQHILDSHQLHRITLDYRRECKHKDIVDSLASLEKNYSKELHKPTLSPVNGIAVNGSSPNGTAINGSSPNGTAINGSSLNGAAINGSSLNGAAINGSLLNGAAVNGSPITQNSKTVSPQGMEFLHLVRFSNNQVEINKGRTVWRSKPIRAE